MIAFPSTQPRTLHHQPGALALALASVDATVAIGTLIACLLAFQGRIDGHALILALLVFSLTFPGGPARGAPRSGPLAVDILLGWLAIAGLLALLGWASRTLDAFDPRAIAVWVAATPAALFAAHRLIPEILPRVFAAEDLLPSAVIVGANELGQQLAAELRGNAVHGIRFAGYFDDRSVNRHEQLRPGECLGGIGQVAEYVKKHHVERIYVALPMASQPRIVRLLEELHDTTASIYFVPDIFVFDLIQARIDTVGDIPVVAVCETPMYGINGLVKRLSDLVFASAILVLITPVLAACAIGVKLSSPGPVIFRQRRYGMDGREILVYKFRTMTVCEDGERVTQAQRDDKRVTRFGAFLRRYSLDELPQFVNVLQGRMSVVGPRPHAVAHNEMYRKLIRGYMFRHKVKPGITGLAQVSGFRGETASLDRMKGRVEHDLAYLRNWSLLLDLKIIVKTVAVVFRGDENAY
ncbi:MAG TPA: undecaprenyl-phosphate glucose phosphotransferase [Burkholderiales bacterium]|nr:undecaprenyl-phosphate glucose phosphotransferase [Burkholderiales bacterium]